MLVAFFFGLRKGEAAQVRGSGQKSEGKPEKIGKASIEECGRITVHFDSDSIWCDFREANCKGSCTAATRVKCLCHLPELREVCLHQYQDLVGEIDGIDLPALAKKHLKTGSSHSFRIGATLHAHYAGELANSVVFHMRWASEIMYNYYARNCKAALAETERFRKVHLLTVRNSVSPCRKNGQFSVVLITVFLVVGVFGLVPVRGRCVFLMAGDGGFYLSISARC